MMLRPTDLSLAIAALDWDKTLVLAKGIPAQAAVWSKRTGFFEGVIHSHCLPLHEACMTTAPVCIVQVILNAHPEAARTKESSYRRLPLHCACRRANADAAVVKTLLSVHKGACLVPDDLGRLPIHYALSNGADTMVIHLLLTTQPQSAKGVDQSGWTPLHVACTIGSPIGVIVALLHAYPDACILRTEKGSTPAKCLSKTCSDRQQIKNLLNEARHAFDANFVNPLYSRPMLLTENHDAVLV